MKNFKISSLLTHKQRVVQAIQEKEIYGFIFAKICLLINLVEGDKFNEIVHHYGVL